MNENISLNTLSFGAEAIIKSVNSKIKDRLFDIGLIPETRVKCVGVSPAGNPKAYYVRGSVFALRNEDCNGILIEGVSDKNE